MSITVYERGRKTEFSTPEEWAVAQEYLAKIEKASSVQVIAPPNVPVIAPTAEAVPVQTQAPEPKKRTKHKKTGPKPIRHGAPFDVLHFRG